MKKLLLPLFILTQFVFADPPGWQDNPGGYEFIASMIPMVYINGEVAGEEGDLLGAFGPDGSMRGVGTRLIIPFGPNAGLYTFDIQLRSNAASDVLTFQFYDASDDTYYDADPSENYPWFDFGFNIS